MTSTTQYYDKRTNNCNDDPSFMDSNDRRSIKSPSSSSSSSSLCCTIASPETQTYLRTNNQRWIHNIQQRRRRLLSSSLNVKMDYFALFLLLLFCCHYLPLSTDSFVIKRNHNNPIIIPQQRHHHHQLQLQLHNLHNHQRRHFSSSITTTTTSPTISKSLSVHLHLRNSDGDDDDEEEDDYHYQNYNDVTHDASHQNSTSSSSANKQRHERRRRSQDEEGGGGSVVVIPNHDQQQQQQQQQQKYNISLLLIDHYDSFTYNLYDMLAQLTIEPPKVISKDAMMGWNKNNTNTNKFDGIVLSPGPGTPEDQPPLSHEVIEKNPNLPILGVCLGHQLLALEYGANVTKAPKPVHGQDHWIKLLKKESTSTTSTCYNIENTTTSNDDDDDDDNNNFCIFDNIPSSFRAVRYHSLAASSESLLSSNNDSNTQLLQVTAVSESDNVIQGLQHKINPHYGIQFHPESIGSQYGMILLNNFCNIVQQYKKDKSDNNINDDSRDRKDDDDDTSHKKKVSSSTPSTITPTTKEEKPKNQPEISPPQQDKKEPARFRVLLHRLSFDTTTTTTTILEPSQVFSHFYADQSTAVWLDSSSYLSSGRGTLDILSSPLSRDDILEYHHLVDDDGDDNNEILTQLEQQLSYAYDMDIGIVDAISSSSDDGKQEDYCIEWTKDTTVAAAAAATSTSDDSSRKQFIPFDYRGGYLGYLGYEVRHDTKRHLQEQEALSGHGLEHDNISRSPSSSTTTSLTTESKASQSNQKKDKDSSETAVPAAAFFLARESMIFHHPTRQWYLLGLIENEDDIKSRTDWIERTRKRMSELSMFYSDDNDATCSSSSSLISWPSKPPLAFVPNRPKDRYAKDIARCHDFIELGESYELCLTNQLEATVVFENNDEEDTVESGSTTLALYQRLRRKNPAPYSAYLKWKDGLSICCSSPERFMSVQRRPTNNDPYNPTYVLEAEAKPIKGTSARVMPSNGIRRSDAEEREDLRRARSLELDLKNRAENLMIVDLLRNDMSRVCEIGSVHVAKLMDIESFATVHQMVSTIRGTLPSKPNTGSSTIELLRASFPGGSMTGAPKIRTMELLEDIEDKVDRGPYSGSLGYLSINGSMDMNIIIRSAVVTTSSSTSENGDEQTKANSNVKKENFKHRRKQHEVSIGAGGAITALSETENEYEEMLLKAQAVVEAVQEWAVESSMKPRRGGGTVLSTVAKKKPSSAMRRAKFDNTAMDTATPSDYSD